MEHSEARELLELAAVEPGGFDRLAAGDTPEASALAGHLAGCPECSDELERLRRASSVIREAVRTTAPPELRERTLALVAAVGRDRSAVALAQAGASVATAVGDMPATAPSAGPIDIDDARRRKSPGVARLGLWAGSIAAGVVIAFVATQLLVVGPQNDQIAKQGREVASLAKAAAWALAIQGQPNAERVALESTTGDSELAGTLVYAPDTNRLVVLAQGLEQPPPGMEYRCWMESGGTRTPIGQMFFAGDIAYWVGEVPDIDGLDEDATFGVSLAPSSDETDVSADPVLSGSLG
jgi:hypothetical protein